MVLSKAERSAEKAGLKAEKAAGKAERKSGEERIGKDHWEVHASQWERLGPPLRPAAEDVRKLTLPAPVRAGPPNVLVLGMTPELVGARWPEGTSLFCADRSPEMVKSLSDEAEKAGATVTLCDWRSMPFPDSMFDLVVGDGCSPSLACPEGVLEMLSEVSRVLVPEGTFSHRFFVRPESPEPDDSVGDESKAGRGSFHAFKLRLLMSMCGTGGLPPGVVRLSDVWDRWSSMRLSSSRLWAEEEVSTISAYQGSPSLYYFPTIREVYGIATLRFPNIECSYPSYELREMCPVLTMRSWA